MRSPSRHLSVAAAATAAAAATLSLLGLAQPALATNCQHGDQRCAGQYQVINDNSVASAMMMGLLNQYTVWILDKTEGNPTRRPDGKPYWGSFLDLTTNQVTPAATFSNAFCAGGTTLGNGTWLVAGGNQPVDEGGAPTGIPNPSGVYQDQDGRKAIRLIEPNNYRANDSRLFWLDNYSANAGFITGNGLQMQSWRWYPGVEPLADGTVVLIGGANNGGYINRNTPNTDPAFAYPTTGGPGSLDNNGLFWGGANPTYEFWPAQGTLRIVDFMVRTSGLNMYPHTFLMPDGRIFMQANYSTTIWDPRFNTEDPLPDMPGKIIRVYPASGATAMLPLTPENDYTPTILFCGGTYLDDDAWGNYTSPNVNVLNVDASKDCSSITPVDANGNTNANAQYVQEEQMPEGRTMGNAIHLPDGKIVILNGAQKGTAGYANVSWNIVNAGQPGEVRTEGLAQNPSYKPLIYDPTKPLGKRLSNAGLGFSDHERLYHSSAILIPDGSVLIAGSNPHQDVSLNMTSGTQPQAYNTNYKIEKWYPKWYFDPRPQPDQLPDTLTYGGRSFTVKIGADYMGQYSNWRAAGTKFRVIRTGFSTHAMNMGQRSLVLQSTYAVNADGSVTYTVNPMPQNPNLFAPGPALLFVDVNGIPSYGKLVQVGWPSLSFQQTVPYAFPNNTALSQLALATNNSMFNEIPPEAKESSGFTLTKIIIVAAVAGVVVLLLGLGIWWCMRRRRANAAGFAGGAGGKRAKMPTGYAPTPGGAWQAGKVGMMGDRGVGGGGGGGVGTNGPDYSRVDSQHAFVPPQHGAFRGSMGTFDSFKMHDVGSQSGGVSPLAGAGAGAVGRPSESREALGAYFDHPRRGNGAASPAPSRSPLGRYDDAGGRGSPAFSSRDLPATAEGGIGGRGPTSRVGSGASSGYGSGGGKAGAEAALLSPYGYQPYDDGYQQSNAYGGAPQQQQQQLSSPAPQHQQQGSAQSQGTGGGAFVSSAAAYLSPKPGAGGNGGGGGNSGGVGGGFRPSMDYAASGMSHGTAEQTFYDASAYQANSFYGHGGR